MTTSRHCDITVAFRTGSPAPQWRACCARPDSCRRTPWERRGGESSSPRARFAARRTRSLRPLGSRMSSQSPPDANTAFVAAARAGAARYRSRDAAIADGFRPVGVEFPAMGEHWVNLARVMADTLDPAMPPVLIYVMVNGKPQLGGVGFTDLLSRGESVGRVPGARFWHEHNGSITEESFPLQHHMGLSQARVPVTICGWRFCTSGRTFPIRPDHSRPTTGRSLRAALLCATTHSTPPPAAPPRSPRTRAATTR